MVYHGSGSYLEALEACYQMEKIIRNPISLYNVIVTLIAIALFTALIKQCSELLCTSNIDRIIDSMQAREVRIDSQVNLLEARVSAKQDSIDVLMQRKHETGCIQGVKEKVKSW